MNDYLYDPFPDSRITPTQEECLTFLAGLSPEDLTGPAGDFVLAMALQGDADVKKKARALLRRKGAPPALLATQKALAREKSPRALYDALVEGKEGRALESMNFAIHRIFATFTTDSIYKHITQIPPHHLDKLIALALNERKSYSFEGESFSGKNVAMQLQGLWPAELIVDAISRLPREVRVLAFGVCEPCSLHDIELPPNLLSLKLCGPVHGLDAIEQMTTLRTLHASHGVDLEGLRAEHLQYVNFESTDLPDWRNVPNLKGVVLSYTHGESFGELGALTELTNLNISAQRDNGGLPDLSPCTKLQSLQLSNVSMGVLPDWIGEFTQLKSLKLLGGVHTLSSALADLELDELHLSWMDFEKVPELVGKAPGYVSLYKTTFPEDLPVSAYTFLRLPSTQQVASELTFFLQQYPGSTALKAVEDFMMGDASAPATEALLAVTRVHVDDEHGPSTNDYLCTLLGEKGGELEVAANAAIPNKFFGSMVSVKNAESKLASVDGIDPHQFRLFCEEMMAVDEGRGLR